MRGLALLVTLLGSVANARSLAVLLLPADGPSDASVAELESFVSDALARHPGVQVQALFPLSLDPAAQAALGKADAQVAAVRRAPRRAPERERQLKAAIQAYARAAPAMTSCGRLCDAIALHAETLVARGATDEARATLLDLIALAPTYELDAQRFGPEVVQLRAKVATGKLSVLRAALSIKSEPSGARAIVDGKAVGYTPLELPSLPHGKHLVHLERPGFQRHGELVTVTDDGATVAAALSPVAAWKAYKKDQARLLDEAVRGSLGPAAAAMFPSGGPEQLVLGTVKRVSETATELSLGLFELRGRRRLGSRKATFQGDEFGQLKAEVGRTVNALMAGERGEKAQPGEDPLENRRGTSDWSEQGPSREAPKSGKKAPPTKDPLDSVEGTEEW